MCDSLCATQKHPAPLLPPLSAHLCSHCRSVTPEFTQINCLSSYLFITWFLRTIRGCSRLPPSVNTRRPLPHGQSEGCLVITPSIHSTATQLQQTAAFIPSLSSSSSQYHYLYYPVLMWSPYFLPWIIMKHKLLKRFCRKPIRRDVHLQTGRTRSPGCVRPSEV